LIKGINEERMKESMHRSVAIVTGISGGLGTELALGLIAEKYVVVGVSRSVPKDPRLITAIEKKAVLHIIGNVSSEQVVEQAFGKASTVGNIEIVINCAGTGIFRPVGKYTREDIDDVMESNLLGTILFSEKAYHRFHSKGITIVNIMSTAARAINVNEAIYCAAKWGARAYTESLRLEAKGKAAKIVAVYPGGMKTGFWAKAKGAKINTSTFMPPAEVARIIIDAIKPRQGSYVSDIIINRI
jgi:short-subunit dehydrogenase